MPSISIYTGIKSSYFKYPCCFTIDFSTNPSASLRQCFHVDKIENKNLYPC